MSILGSNGFRCEQNEMWMWSEKMEEAYRALCGPDNLFLLKGRFKQEGKQWVKDRAREMDVGKRKQNSCIV